MNLIVFTYHINKDFDQSLYLLVFVINCLKFIQPLRIAAIYLNLCYADCPALCERSPLAFVLELDLETLFESPRADTAVPALVVRTANFPLV